MLLCNDKAVDKDETMSDKGGQQYNIKNRVLHSLRFDQKKDKGHPLESLQYNI